MQAQAIDPPEGATYFGRVVTLRGDTLLIASSRLVHVYHCETDGWRRQYTLGGREPDLNFGAMILIGDTEVLGGPYTDIDGNEDAGAV